MIVNSLGFETVGNCDETDFACVEKRTSADESVITKIIIRGGPNQTISFLLTSHLLIKFP